MKRLNSTIDKWCGLWYNVYTVKGRNEYDKRKSSKKSFAKPLDKLHIMWYNNSVPRGNRKEKYL